MWGWFSWSEDAAVLLKRQQLRNLPERGMFSTEEMRSSVAELRLLLHCRACLGRNSVAINLQREFVVPLPQSLGSQRPFASGAEGRPAAEDTEANRILETLPPTTEQYKAARAFEARFEGWRCVQGVS